MTYGTSPKGDYSSYQSGSRSKKNGGSDTSSSPYQPPPFSGSSSSYAQQQTQMMEDTMRTNYQVNQLLLLMCGFKNYKITNCCDSR